MVNPLLEQLAPIAQPTVPGLWPLAYGWWILIVLTLLALGYSIYQWATYYRFWAVKRQAIAALPHCHNASEINGIIKQVAIHYFPQAEIANAQGLRWASFLNDIIKTDLGVLQQTVDELYQPTNVQHHQRFNDYAVQWLTRLSKKSINEANYA